MAIISVFPQTITGSRPVLRAHCDQLYIYMKGSDDIYLDSYCEVREMTKDINTTQTRSHRDRLQTCYFPNNRNADKREIRQCL